VSSHGYHAVYLMQGDFPLGRIRRTKHPNPNIVMQQLRSERQQIITAADGPIILIACSFKHENGRGGRSPFCYSTIGSFAGFWLRRAWDCPIIQFRVRRDQVFFSWRASPCLLYVSCNARTTSCIVVVVTAGGMSSREGLGRASARVCGNYWGVFALSQ
jgi:hypothetical protein